MSFELPIPKKINLIRSNQREDVAALSINSNKNSKTLEDKINELIDVYEETREIIESLQNSIQNKKLFFDVEESIGHEETINENNFLLTKYINSTISTYSFIIVDLNSDRSTDFRKMNISVTDNSNKRLNNLEVYSTQTSITVHVDFDALPLNNSVKLLLT